jgi:hypothetical protein
VGSKFIFGGRKKMCVERNLSLAKAKVGKKRKGKKN